jgi:hypothetical protein
LYVCLGFLSGLGGSGDGGFGELLLIANVTLPCAARWLCNHEVASVLEFAAVGGVLALFSTWCVCTLCGLWERPPVWLRGLSRSLEGAAESSDARWCSATVVMVDAVVLGVNHCG